MRLRNNAGKKIQMKPKRRLHAPTTYEEAKPASRIENSNPNNLSLKLIKVSSPEKIVNAKEKHQIPHNLKALPKPGELSPLKPIETNPAKPVASKQVRISLPPNEKPDISQNVVNSPNKAIETTET